MSKMKQKTVDDEKLLNEGGSSSRKRGRRDNTETIEDFTPTKRRPGRKSVNEDLDLPHASFFRDGSERGSPGSERGEDAEADGKVGTPSKKGRGRPKGGRSEPQLDRRTSTPKRPSHGKSLFSTPKANGEVQENGTPSDRRNADRSARRKSARTIIERAIADNISGDEEDEDIARHIYEDDEEDDVAVDDNEKSDDTQEPDSVPTTPSKRRRGRPKDSKNRKRLPTPPQGLPPHELYFSQNRGAGMKTSNNNLSSLALLDHEEYFNLIRNYRDPHADDMEFLQELHTRSFNQWQFELSQDFNICMYGWGSKRTLLTGFANHLYKTQTDHRNNKIIIVNGYVHTVTIRDILNTLASAISDHPPKLGSQVAEMLETLCAILEANKAQHITLIIHSIDSTPLRRPTTQTLLARLASHPQIYLIASADHPSFPILWDSSLRSTYNFIFHDCTTFQPYSAEVDVVNEVHELLGRSGRRVGGKEGVSFVLKSLNQNSRKLFQLLVAEQLATMDDGGFAGGVDENDNIGDLSNSDRRGNGNKLNDQGVEYRLLYQKAVEDFICGDEVSFRTLLKEFHDHQMIHSRKDAVGTEMLSVPFRKEELEAILEDLMA